MHLDVQDLRDFYYRTQLGRVAQAAIRTELLRLWPPAAGQTVVGYGFAVPLLRPWLLGGVRRVIGLMPGPQGVMPWPPAQVGPDSGGEALLQNISVLCEEGAWPLPTGLVDRLVVMHGLEATDHPGVLLEEAHRVLGPGGRAVFVVPNRAGLWARRDVTPFGSGRSWSAAQLERHLRAHGFTPERSFTVLHTPPSHAPFWMRTADICEALGRRLPWLSGGVLMVEASKQVYAPTQRGLKAAVARPLRVLEGVRAPSPKPALSRRPDRSGR